MNRIIDIIKYAHSQKNDTIKVKIQNRSVYHKFAEVEIEVDKKDFQHYLKYNTPKGANEEGYISDYLQDNADLYTDKIDTAMSEANFEYGSGVDDYRGMNEPHSSSEWRFECDELKEGGHL